MLPALRNEAISVLNNKLNWEAELPIIEGIISLMIRFTPSSFHPQVGFGKRFIVFKKGSKKIN